jgi:hypothetical protein
MSNKPEFRGYRGSSTIKQAGTVLEFTQEQQLEILRCSEDPIYFAEKYMKIVHVDHGLMTIKLYPYQKDMILSMHNERYTIAECARQSGKALPLDTKIPTPNGWTTMGELSVGDKLFDENGNETYVRSTSKIFKNHDCYKITFDDNTTVNADSDHLWVVKKSSNRDKNNYKMTTKELFDSGVTYKDSREKEVSLWKIPLSGPVNYPKKETKIDPYTLGLWLGDGNSSGGRFTCHKEDLDFYKKELLFEFSENHEKRNENVYTGTIYNLSPKLRKYNLLKNKHIPNEFLHNDIDSRINLLQGLMDSDGTIEKNGRNCICFSYNRYPQLIDDTHELLLSLGLKVQKKEYKKTNSVRLYFNCPLTKFPVFRLPRKAEKQQITNERPWHTNHRYIRKIEKIDSVPTKCIEVANKSHLFLCSEYFIPTHNTTAVTAYLLWYILFNEFKNVAILANKGDTSQEILSRIRLAFEFLPMWLQQGVVKWNEKTIELENGSEIRAGTTTSTNIRGFSINFLFLDEAAFIEGWDKFFTSVYPTISSGKTSKIMMVSTVNGLNHFYQLTTNARRKRNKFNLISVVWKDVPGRDEEWRQETLANMNYDEELFAQEFENRYLGSSGTLIAGWKLTELVDTNPVFGKDCLWMYEKPKQDHIYSLVADVSRGKGLDYSAFQIIDITKMPYQQVMAYKNNQITPTDFAEIIYRMATHYNTASVLVETNDIGEQVGDLLYDEFAYENVLFTATENKRKVITQIWGKTVDRGVRTTKSVKSVGCSLLKLLVEQNQLLLHNYETIEELKTFSKKGTSYEAEQGHHDDLTMCLVLFAWFSDQEYFHQVTELRTLDKLRDRSAEEIEKNMIPFGYVNDGGDYTSLEDALELDKLKDENWLVAGDLDRFINSPYDPFPLDNTVNDETYIGFVSDEWNH